MKPPLLMSPAPEGAGVRVQHLFSQRSPNPPAAPAAGYDDLKLLEAATDHVHGNRGEQQGNDF